MLYAYEKEKSVGPKERKKKYVCMCESEKKKKHIQIWRLCVYMWRGFVRVRVCVYNNKSKCV